MPDNRPRKVNLNNYANGALAELFHHELRKVLDNMKDANTSAKAKRSLTMKIDFMPYPDRHGAETVLAVTSKLAPVNTVKSNVFLSADEEGTQAYSTDTRQEELPLDDVSTDTPSLAVVAS